MLILQSGAIKPLEKRRAQTVENNVENTMENGI